MTKRFQPLSDLSTRPILRPRVRSATLTLALAGLLLNAGPLISAASAQVAPPPPAPPAPEPEYVPAPRPAARPQTVENENTRAVERQRRNARGDNGIPDLFYVPMAQTGDDGKVIRIGVPLHYLALKHNPTVGQTVADELPIHILGRRVRFEEVLFRYLQDLELLEGGLLEDLNIFDGPSITAASEALKNLVGPTTLTQELESKKILTAMQARFNAHIVQEYENAVRAEIERDYGENAMNEQIRFMFDSSLQEVRDARAGLLLESMNRIDAVLEKMQEQAPDYVLGEQARSSIAALVPDEVSDVDQIALLDALRAEFDGWTIEQRREFLRAVAATRGNRMAVPMPLIDVTEGKSVRYDTPPEILGPGGKKIDTTPKGTRPSVDAPPGG